MISCIAFSCFGCKAEMELKSGSYVLEHSGMIADPVLEIDAENKRFSFSFSMLSSYWPSGSYMVDKDVLTAQTDDGMNIYRFRIINQNTLAFLQESSSEVPSIGEKQATADEAKFTYFDRTEIDMLRQNLESAIEKDGTIKYYICKLIEYSMYCSDEPFVDFEAKLNVHENVIDLTVPRVASAEAKLDDSNSNHLYLTIQLSEDKKETAIEYTYHYYKRGVYVAPSMTFSNDLYSVDYIEMRSSNGEKELLFSDSGYGVYPMMIDHENYCLLVNDPKSPYYMTTLPDKGRKNSMIYSEAAAMEWESDDFEERLIALANTLSHILIQNAN